MKNIISLFLFIFFIPGIASFAQDPLVKNLRTYSIVSEIGFPIISNESSAIIIEFDVQSNYQPDMNIVFRYCDKNWKPVDNIFLLNTGKNIFYSIGFTKLPHTVLDADYHFQKSFPDAEGLVSFPFTGKWRYYITDAQDTANVFADGKFIVAGTSVPLTVSVKNEELEDKVYFPADLKKIFNITTSFTLPDELFPNYVSFVEIIENKKIDYPTIIDKNFNTNVRQYYWDGNRKFTFTARDIRPGNEYRQTDLRNTNKFISNNVKAQFDGIELSRFFIQGEPDFNGGSQLTKYSDEYATYMNVKFNIRTPEDFGGEVFLVGAFNNWRLSPDYKMLNEGGRFTKSLSLKRGAYDYQYVTADIINGEIKNADWQYLEGNSWETSNEYYIFLYYTDPNFGGYDKIIGYKKIITK